MPSEGALSSEGCSCEGNYEGDSLREIYEFSEKTRGGRGWESRNLSTQDLWLINDIIRRQKDELSLCTL